MNPVTPVSLSRSTRMLRPHKALRMLEEGNNALVKRVNEQSAAIVQLWARMIKFYPLKQECLLCGRVYIGFGSPVCPPCEMTEERIHEQTAKARSSKAAGDQPAPIAGKAAGGDV